MAPAYRAARRRTRAATVTTAAVSLVAVGSMPIAAAALGRSVSRTFQNGATVTRVLDADTVEILLDGRTTRVRLLGIDSPDPNDTNAPECLGTEAQARLQQLLPGGTDVTLAYDVDRIDSSGRLLAAVYRDDTLVNAEMARAGYGVPEAEGDDSRYRGEIVAAYAQARAAHAGLFSPDAGCTVPARLAELRRLAVRSSGTPDEARAVVAGADSLTRLLAQDGIEVRAVAAELPAVRADIAAIRADAADDLPTTTVSPGPATSQAGHDEPDAAPSNDATTSAPGVPAPAATAPTGSTPSATSAPSATGTAAPADTSPVEQAPTERGHVTLPQPQRTTQSPRPTGEGNGNGSQRSRKPASPKRTQQDTTSGKAHRQAAASQHPTGR